ncbi:two pore domain potassium channel family protein [Candidatus Kaiserbacteria bacterium]|nr:two pore domain potassium channel family protein [Candidatus Kaiserbacteria bacterium]
MFTFLYTFYRFGRSVRAALRDPEFEVLLTLVILVLGVGTIFYHGVEGWRYLDALYFCVVTLGTVGFGDFAPQTDAGKIFTIVYIFVGIGILFGFINKMAHHAVEENKSQPLISHRLGLRRRRRHADEKIILVPEPITEEQAP